MPRRIQFLDGGEEGLELAGIVEVGACVAELAVDLRQRRAAQAVLPAPRSISSSSVSPWSSRSCGVSVRRTSCTGAKAVTISDSGRA